MDIHIDHITINLNDGDTSDIINELERLAADMNEWMADIHHHLKPPSPSSALSRSAKLHEEVFGPRPFKGAHYDLDRLMDDLEATGNYDHVLGRTVHQPKGAFFIATAIVDCDNPLRELHDFNGQIAIAMPIAGILGVVQYWPVEDCKQLVNMLTTQIAAAEQRQDAPETHQDGR
jgi:hypothetical protein